MKIPTRASQCPLCLIPAAPLIAFEFAPKSPLSDRISFLWCCHCDFIFAEQLDAEIYRDFYRSALHDTAHVSDACTRDNLHLMQARLLGEHLGSGFCGSCLDFGAGEGQLLTKLAEALPRASLFGTDLRNSLRAGTPALFLESLDASPRYFDAIILSHVAEHLIDLSDLSRVTRHLAPNGVLYVEVPDPLGYPECPRREFMYYFDRLHVNHFSQTALIRWLGAHSLRVTEHGSHRFAYRDGQYPAQYVFACATRGAGRPSHLGTLPSIRHAFDRYHDGENVRGSELREFIVAAAGKRSLLAYGRGDNYFRAKAHGGPLHGLPIEAVLDRNAAALSNLGECILTPQVGLARYPHALLLMTVSAGADKIVADIRAQTPDRSIIMI